MFLTQRETRKKGKRKRQQARAQHGAGGGRGETEEGWVGGYTGRQQQSVVSNNYDAYKVIELHIKSAIFYPLVFQPSAPLQPNATTLPTTPTHT